MIYLAGTRLKRRVFDDFLAVRGRHLGDTIQVVDYETVAGLEILPRATWVLGDLDGLGPAGLELARAVHDAVTAADLLALNHPDLTLRRFELLRTLHEHGVNDFNAERANGDLESLRYPVFVRGASDHFGPLGSLLESPSEVRATTERAGEAGIDVDDLIVVEYRETVHPDGLYRKYGAYVVGAEVIPQHLMVSDDWMVKHRRSVFTRDICIGEHEWARVNPHEDRLREIFRLAGVEYGRLDYSVDPDGRIQVWEINLFPIVDRGRAAPSGLMPEELRPIREKTKDLFYRRFEEAWRALDTVETGGTDIPLVLPDDIRSGMEEESKGMDAGSGLMAMLRSKAFFRDRW